METMSGYKLQVTAPIAIGARFAGSNTVGKPISKFPNFQISKFLTPILKFSNLPDFAKLLQRQAGSQILKFSLFALLLSNTSSIFAQVVPSTQPEKTDTRKGNQQFKKENYTDAEADYKKALDKKKNMPEASFNLGDAVYEQKRYDEAAKQFEAIGQSNVDDKIKAKAFHNLGNSYLEQRKWDDAVKSYKESLRINPNDNDTKYNLAYANAMIMKQKQQQQQNKDQKKDNKDKKDDKKDQGKNDNKQQKPDSKPDDQQGKNDQQKQQPKQAQAKLSKEDAEKLLQALQNEEQKTNQKMQQKTAKPVNAKIEKDW
jgi:tetratricopeptide (TPR) repeat protein